MKRAFNVSAVQNAERPLLEQGEPLMAKAAYAVATAVLRHLRDNNFRIPGSTVLVLAGSGNNGGDALYAAGYLARRGLQVVSVTTDRYHLEAAEFAYLSGVKMVKNPTTEQLRALATASGIWVDGLLGIGVYGKLREPFASWVSVLCAERDYSPLPPLVVAVDVPSGVDADNGTYNSPILPADITVTMGCDKPALLLPPAAFLAGKIEVVDLGFTSYLPANPNVCEISAMDIVDLWEIPEKFDHKYSRGVLGFLTGSNTYPGAAVLGVGGARALGVGMLRYLGENADVVLAYPETVTVFGKTHAWVIGSGMTDFAPAYEMVVCEAECTPIVLDAGAINYFYERGISGNIVITPHTGELVSLLHLYGITVTPAELLSQPLYYARIAAQKTGATVVLKGAITLIVSPAGEVYAQGGATSWLATAGTGDVLAGILGAILAMKSARRELRSADLARCAAASVYLHTEAANRVAKYNSQSDIGIPLAASDIIRGIPQVLYTILNGGA